MIEITPGTATLGTGGTLLWIDTYAFPKRQVDNEAIIAGSLEGSARGYEEALDLARDRDEPVHKAAALASLSVVYRGLGRLRESVRCGREALGLL
jgi:hypothetical protein